MKIITFFAFHLFAAEKKYSVLLSSNEFTLNDSLSCRLWVNSLILFSFISKPARFSFSCVNALFFCTFFFSYSYFGCASRYFKTLLGHLTSVNVSLYSKTGRCFSAFFVQETFLCYHFICSFLYTFRVSKFLMNRWMHLGWIISEVTDNSSCLKMPNNEFRLKLRPGGNNNDGVCWFFIETAMNEQWTL